MGVQVKERKRNGVKTWCVILEWNGKTTENECENRAEAESIAASLRAELKKDKPVITVKSMGEEWFKTDAQARYKPSTLRGYKSLLKNHIYHELKDTDITQMTRPDVNDLLRDKLKAGLSVNRVSKIKALLSDIFNFSIDKGVIDGNPTQGAGRMLQGKAQSESKQNPFSVEELCQYLKTMKSIFPRQFPFFLTLARTGMRSGEGFALKWSDLDFNRNIIHIQRNLPDGSSVTTPKSGKDRNVVMSPQLNSVLQDHMERTTKEIESFKWSVMPEWVFPNQAGNPYSRANITNRYHNKAIKAAGVKRVRIHDLRHTYAAIRLNKGDDIYDVSKQMGHQSIQTTIDLYGKYHVTTRSHDQVAELDDPEWNE